MQEHRDQESQNHRGNEEGNLPSFAGTVVLPLCMPTGQAARSKGGDGEGTLPPSRQLPSLELV